MISFGYILNISDSYNYDDWILLVLILSFILMCFLIGLNRTEYRNSIKSLFKYKGKGAELVFSSLGTIGYLFMLLQVSLAIGVSHYILFSKTVAENPETLKVLMVSSLIVFSILFIKVNICNFINYFLYKRRLLIVPSSLWTGFYVLYVFTFGSFITVISILFFLFSWPIHVGRIIFIITALIVEFSIITKLYKVFFRKKIDLLIFFLYLCALEFAPTVLVWLLLG